MTNEQKYEIVTAYSGSAKAAAFIVSLGGHLYKEGRTTLQAPSDKEKELIACIEGLRCIPSGSTVVVKTNLEYLLIGGNKFVSNDPAKHKLLKGINRALWREIGRQIQRLHAEFQKAGSMEHRACKSLANSAEGNSDMYDSEKMLVGHRQARLNSASPNYGHDEVIEKGEFMGINYKLLI